MVKLIRHLCYSLIIFLFCSLTLVAKEASPSFSAVDTNNEISKKANNSDTEKIAILEQRIAELEKIVNKVNEPQTQPNSTESSKLEEVSDIADLALYSYEDLSETINTSLKVSGYADVEFKGYSDSTKNAEFRMHHLSLFFTKAFNNNIKFFSEIEYEDAPKFEGTNDGSGDIKVASGKIFVEAVNFDWNHSQYVNMRVGRFFTPAGIWSEDHYPPFVTTQERPLHIRKIFPQLVDGMSIFGSLDLSDDHIINYNTYLGNGESNNNLSGKKDSNSNKAVGFKADYHAPWFDEFLLGITLYQDNNDSSINDYETLNADKVAWGTHLKVRISNITLQAEYAKSDHSFDDATNNFKDSGYYAQAFYSLNQWDFGARYDVYDEYVDTNNKKQRNSVFINYQVNHNIVLKAEYHDDSYDTPLKVDSGFYIFSITGFLGN